MYLEKDMPQVETKPLKFKFQKPSLGMPLSVHLATKEIWRNKGRFTLIALVIALITTLVLFVDGLSQGLGAGNIAYLSKLNADLLVYQEKTDLSIAASRLSREDLRYLERIDGVKAVGPLGFSSASLYFGENKKLVKISLIGVEPGLPGEPPAFQGRQLKNTRGKEAIIDKNVAARTGLKVGDKLTIKVVQGTEDKYYSLKIVGLSDDRQYSIQPSVFVPNLVWDQIKPQANVNETEPGAIFNIIAVQLDDPAATETMATRLSNAGKFEAVDKVTAYRATPGYSAQQSTLNTQRFFTLLIGVLVIGGFFQIQTLQKVAQIGMLKAIGAPTPVIAISFLLQIVLITAAGILIGSAGTLGLSMAFPPTVPITFTPTSVMVAVSSLLAIGPAAGLISLRILLKVEPLTALGLAS